MVLYQLEQCPFCTKVRTKLEELGLEYEKVNVPRSKEEREEVFHLSGQRAVPVLKDGSKTISDSEEIMVYLDKQYG